MSKNAWTKPVFSILDVLGFYFVSLGISAIVLIAVLL